MLSGWHIGQLRPTRIGAIMFVVLAIAVAGVALAVSAVLVGVARVIGSGK